MLIILIDLMFIDLKSLLMTTTIVAYLTHPSGVRYSALVPSLITTIFQTSLVSLATTILLSNLDAYVHQVVNVDAIFPSMTNCVEVMIDVDGGISKI